jgi:hypothetical protein
MDVIINLDATGRYAMYAESRSASEADHFSKFVGRVVDALAELNDEQLPGKSVLKVGDRKK